MEWLFIKYASNSKPGLKRVQTGIIHGPIDRNKALRRA